MSIAFRVSLAGGSILALLLGTCGVVRASPFTDAPQAAAAQAVRATTPSVIEGCILAAAQRYRLPPAVLVILLNVEGGTVGHVSLNTNDTVDIGPMQVNEIWLPQLARLWDASVGDTFRAVRDNFCANVAAGSWILRQALDEAHGDFWQGVAIYHSHDPGYQCSYLGQVLHEVLRLEPQPPRTKAAHMQVAGR